MSIAEFFSIVNIDRSYFSGGLILLAEMSKRLLRLVKYSLATIFNVPQ